MPSGIHPSLANTCPIMTFGNLAMLFGSEDDHSLLVNVSAFLLGLILALPSPYKPLAQIRFLSAAILFVLFII